MESTQGRNDPLDPMYPHDPGQATEPRGIHTLTKKTNLVFMVVIAVVIMAALYFLAGESPKSDLPAPAATVVQ